MAGVAEEYGKWIRRDAMVICPVHGPGHSPASAARLHEDGDRELRPCPEIAEGGKCDHILETVAYVTAKPSEVEAHNIW